MKQVQAVRRSTPAGCRTTVATDSQETATVGQASGLRLRCGNDGAPCTPRSLPESRTPQALAMGPVVVAGSGRSGTTWVLDVLAEANRMRPVFEPLHPAAGAVARKYAHRFVREDAREPDLHDYMSRVMRGDFSSLWTDFRVRPDRLWPAPNHAHGPGRAWISSAQRWKRLAVHYLKYRKSRGFQPPLVKFIRANLMLGWLKENFDVPIVLLLRHPGAVIESRLRLGGPDWQSSALLERFRADRELCDTHLGGVGTLLHRELSPVEAHAMAWCIENQIPLQDARRLGLVVIFYETLVGSSEHEWGGLVDRLSLRNTPTAASLSRPSQQSRQNWSRVASTDLSAGWRTRVDGQFIAELQGMLDAFGVDVYRASEPMPCGSLPAESTGHRSP